MISIPAKITLGQWPTPLTKLPNLSQRLGIELEIKRDDLSGLALGGNKTRKLEPILADALARGCDAVITAGAVQSNHCRQTAAAAAQLGLECHLILGGNEYAHAPKQGNLLLDHLFGSVIHWAGDKRKGEGIPELEQQLLAHGKKPYVVPYGGSNALGASAYVAAMQELALQKEGSRKYSCIIFASSSGGTHAGLLVGNMLYQQADQIIGINIDKADSPVLLSEHILNLCQQTCELFGASQPIEASHLQLNTDYDSAGYGVLGDQEKAAISLMAKTEGILLDPVYSGRAFAGLLDLVEKRRIARGDRVLFWHTGGAPALFDYAEEF